jgi:hypothetical protein
MLSLGDGNNVSTADAYNKRSADPDSVHEETIQNEESSGAYNTYVGWWLPDGTVKVSGNGSSPGKGSPSRATSGCPKSAQLLLAWRKHRGIMTTNSRITGFSHIACWRNWVIAAPIGVPEGNGLFEFNSIPTLHGLSSTELTQFNLQVCADASALKKWGEPGMC